VKALRVRNPNSPELRYEEAPMPEPGIADVLLEVRAASFTPTELQWPSTWVDHAGKDRTPSVPAHEVCGQVRSLGYGTAGFSIGDEVYGMTDWYRDGAAADFVAVEARNLASKPASVSVVEAASLPLAGLTAWQALFVHGQLRPNQTVVITGASGGVGTIAVQLAHDAGARVVAVAHAWARQVLEDLGADEFIDADNPRAAEGADLLFDLVGGESIVQCSRMLHRGGTIVSVVNPNLPIPDGARGVFFVVEPDRDQLRQLAEMVDARRIRPIVGKTVAMRDAAEEAFAAKHRGGVVGKVVLA
jgi:NADPH:quinone reductase-like Zn-dependent oxidoreductase